MINHKYARHMHMTLFSEIQCKFSALHNPVFDKEHVIFFKTALKV